jgi:hypothetical protein
MLMNYRRHGEQLRREIRIRGGKGIRNVFIKAKREIPRSVSSWDARL